MKFNDYPAAKIAQWIDSLGRPIHIAPKRAWRKFTDWACETYGDFADLTVDGGFSGSAKLLAAVPTIQRLRAAGESLDSLTVGDLSRLAAERGWPLGYLPPVDHAVTMARMAGRKDAADRLRAVDPRSEIFG